MTPRQSFAWLCQHLEWLEGTGAAPEGTASFFQVKEILEAFKAGQLGAEEDGEDIKAEDSKWEASQLHTLRELKDELNRQLGTQTEKRTIALDVAPAPPAPPKWGPMGVRRER